MKPRLVPLSPRGQMLLATACGCLLVGTVFSDPGSAYEGFFEMIGQAAASIQRQNQPAAPPSVAFQNDYPAPVATPSPIGKPYNRGNHISESTFRRLGYLKFPQHRGTMDGVLGKPLASSYGSSNGFEEHRLFDGRLLSVVYRG